MTKTNRAKRTISKFWMIVNRKTGAIFNPKLGSGVLNARVMVSRSGVPIVIYNHCSSTTVELIDMDIWEVSYQ